MRYLITLAHRGGDPVIRYAIQMSRSGASGVWWLVADG